MKLREGDFSGRCGAGFAQVAWHQAEVGEAALAGPGIAKCGRSGTSQADLLAVLSFEFRPGIAFHVAQGRALPIEFRVLLEKLVGEKIFSAWLTGAGLEGKGFRQLAIGHLGRHCAARIEYAPRAVNTLPCRAARVGRTQSNRSTPCPIIASICGGVPTPIT